LDRLRQFLASQGVVFREVHHEVTRTSAESARARGEELRVGGKALVVKADDTYHLCVLPADCKLNSAAVKTVLGARKIRFASGEELLELTGLVPGSVPPFGRPILPFQLFADVRLIDNDRIAFNAGSLTTSFVLPMADYVRVAQPTLVVCAIGEGEESRVELPARPQ
jgi:prolyl-tRNA editing enzyme YbaK/EbsC (Cys-tRNA(Pro) deacylase)